MPPALEVNVANKTFHPGQVVTGTVIFHPAMPTTVSAVLVELAGFARTSLATNKATREVNMDASVLPEHPAEYDWSSETHLLVRVPARVHLPERFAVGPDRFLFPRGRYALPFEVELPHVAECGSATTRNAVGSPIPHTPMPLPPSYSGMGPAVVVQYVVKAEVPLVATAGKGVVAEVMVGSEGGGGVLSETTMAQVAVNMLGVPASRVNLVVSTGSGEGPSEGSGARRKSSSSKFRIFTSRERDPDLAKTRRPSTVVAMHPLYMPSATNIKTLFKRVAPTQEEIPFLLEMTLPRGNVLVAGEPIGARLYVVTTRAPSLLKLNKDHPYLPGEVIVLNVDVRLLTRTGVCCEMSAGERLLYVARGSSAEGKRVDFSKAVPMATDPLWYGVEMVLAPGGEVRPLAFVPEVTVPEDTTPLFETCHFRRLHRLKMVATVLTQWDMPQVPKWSRKVTLECDVVVVSGSGNSAAEPLAAPVFETRYRQPGMWRAASVVLDNMSTLASRVRTASITSPRSSLLGELPSDSSRTHVASDYQLRPTHPMASPPPPVSPRASIVSPRPPAPAPSPPRPAHNVPAYNDTPPEEELPPYTLTA